MTGPNDPTQMFTVEYDGEEGELHVYDFGVHQAIEVRKGLMDKAILIAAIIEIERLGYTVISPEEPS